MNKAAFLTIFAAGIAGQCLASSDYHVIVIGDLKGGAVFARPYAINNNGAVVGASIISDSGRSHAFYWDSSNGLINLASRNGLNAYSSSAF
ncbi:MAG: hypothetical protein AB8F26_01485 [Phycisphaerales bacterium]